MLRVVIIFFLCLRVWHSVRISYLGGKDGKAPLFYLSLMAILQGNCCCPFLCFCYNWCHFFQSGYDFSLVISATRWLPNCPFLAMFNALSLVLLSGAAHFSCQEGLLYCSASRGLSGFMTFQSELMIEISICFRRELSTGPELRKWAASSSGGIECPWVKVSLIAILAKNEETYPSFMW